MTKGEPPAVPDQASVPEEDIRDRGLALRVSGRELGKGRLLDLRQPFAVVGRSHRAEISLRSSKISFRHAYLQVLDQRVFCCDLTSKTGLHWGDQKRSYGWVSARSPVRIGPYHLRLADDSSAESKLSSNDPLPNPLEEPVRPGLFPKYCLELFDDSVADPIRSIDRRITLIGRDATCALQLEDESVSRVHCALVLNPDGLWVVDLLGKGGILLDGKPVQLGQAQSGSELVVGQQAMAFWRHDSELRAGPDEDARESGVTANVDTTHELGSLKDWLGTLFAIEYHGETLVVIPTIRSGMFRYAKLQIELNALRHKLLQSEVSRLLLDLSGLDYPGSEVMCAVVALARQTESRGGRIALCSATTQAESALTRMGLSRIWTLYPTRDAALAALNPR
jgi:pSer/pThr/pTyr-binding forkhead associated (FHA) protein/anti-anti-sigma regulatory factor